MDPVSLIVAALVAGASAGAKDLATQAVKDAYAGLKNLLTRRQIDVSAIERKPDSKAQQAALTETLSDSPNVVDDELLQAAKTVADAVAADAPSAGPAVGVDLERVQAEFLRIGKVRAEGTGVRLRDGTFTGGIDIDQVDAGQTAPESTAEGPSRR